MACQRSQSSCSPSQKSADIPKTLPSLRAVSSVTPLLLLIISFNRGNDTPSLSAKSTWLTPSGLRNSSSNISPGCVGGRFVGSRLLAADLAYVAGFEDPRIDLVVVRDFNTECISILPSKTYPILLIYSDTYLSFPISLQLFQLISRRNCQVPHSGRPVDLIQFSTGRRPKVLRALFSSWSTV